MIDIEARFPNTRCQGCQDTDGGSVIDGTLNQVTGAYGADWSGLELAVPSHFETAQIVVCNTEAANAIRLYTYARYGGARWAYVALT